MKTKSLIVLGILIMHLSAISQVKIGDNPTAINSASLLELEAINKGFVLPRVSITDVSASAPLAAGLITGTVVYNTNSSTTGGSGVGIYIWNGTMWLAISTGSINSSAWLLAGNSGLNASTNFIGTTDAIDFVARTNNTERMRILGAASGSSKAGWIGMGIAVPRSSLDISGHYSNKNVITIQNSSTAGYSSVDMMDSAGNLKGTFGYANLGTGSLFSGKDYFNIYGNDFLFTTNSGNNDFFIKGSSGYIGLNTNSPSERLHLVGNFYLNGAFMSGGDAGTSGYILTSAGAATSPVWTRSTSLSWGLTGNSGTSYSTNFLGTADNVSMRFRTNNVQRMIIDSIGRIGIGLNNPSYALSVLSASNPLYLSGVQATSSINTDSVLTINSGVVKKTAYSSLNNTFWSLTGNSGTNYSTNFLGTADNVSLRFRTNNIEQMIIDSLGNVGIGSSVFNAANPAKLLVDYGTTTSNTIVNLRGSTDNYFQINLQNKSNGTSSSSDYVATANDGTDSTYYVDFGINSSTYAPSVENWGGPHDAYLYSNSRHLLLGAQSSNSDLIFLLGGGRTKTNTVMRIDGPTGNIIIGKGDNNDNATGNIIRGPNGNGTNIPGGSLTLQGGAATGTATGGSLSLYGGSTASGTYGAVNINAGTNSATNINTGTSTGTITIGNALNNINLPKLSAASVVLTDAGKNLTSSAPSNNSYLYYNGTNFTWATAASSLASLTNGSGIASLNYNGSSAGTVSLANGTAAGQVYVTGATPFTPALVTMSGDATISSAGALSLATVNGNIGTFNNVTVNVKGLVTAASNVSYTTLGSFSATSPLSYNNATGVFSISQANTLTNGYLSLTDWNTFNNKIGSITLNTPSSVFSNPINFAVSSGAATGSLSFNTQTANTVFAGPASGVAATPAFRALVASDIPSLAGSYIQNQTTLQASSNFNISGNGTIGTNLAVTGTSTLTGAVTSGGGITNTGILTSSGGIANINASSNNATNINTGTSTSTVTIGGISNNVNLPKLSASSVVLTDAGKNLTSSTPSNNTYLYYNGANFTWATAASSLASLTNGSGIAALNYNGSSAGTVSLANGTAAGQVYVTGATPFTPSLVTMSGDATISSAGVLSLATLNSNTGTFNNVTVNAKGLVTAASNVSYTTLGSFSATSPLSYNNATGVFSISQANTLTNGYLSFTDWNTFNNKVGSITLNTPSSVFSNPINFSVSSGAATGSLSFNTQTANTVFAGPASGVAATPAFRALVASDIPSLAGSYIQNQTTLQASSNFNISGNGIIGTNLSVTGTSTLTGAVTSGGGITNTGAFTTSGGTVNINANSLNATNINTGFSLGTVTLGNALNNINLPKLSASSVVLTDASKNLTSTTPSNNTYLYYNGTNFTWATAASLGSFSATSPLSYNNATGVFSISQANTLTNGYLSSADWNTFNNKVGSITLNTPSSVFSNPINFSVSSGAATGSLSFNTQTANTVFAGPASGIASAPAFRALVAADIPSLAGSYIQNQTTLQASSNFNISGNGTIGTNLAVTGTSTLTGAVTSSGGITNTGILTSSGGTVNINSSSNNATNINTGTSTSNITIGNSSNNILLPKFNTVGGLFFTSAATGQINNTATDMTWDDVNNRLGIGITSPSSALHVNGVVSLGKSTTTTGRLTFYNSSNSNTIDINSGVTSASYDLTLPTDAPSANGQTLVSTTTGTLSWATVSGVGTSGAWQLTGNAGTNGAINFVGTIDAQPLVIKSLNRQMASFDGNLYNVGLGNGAINSGDHNVAIGYNAISSNQYALALGYNSIASGVGSIAIGNGSGSTIASSPQSVAIGYNTLCSAGQGLALGYQATTSGQYGIAMGYGSLASGTQSAAIGYASSSTGQYAMAMGYSAQATGIQSFAMGAATQATGVQSAAIGYGATTTQANAIVLGNNTATVGIGISTPNTNTKLDVDGKFKMGDIGTVNKNIVSFTSALSTVNVPAGISGKDYTSGFTDITLTIPSGTNYLSSTQATVSVSPSLDLPLNVHIAFARMISTSQLKIRLMNSSSIIQVYAGQFYITITEF